MPAQRGLVGRRRRSRAAARSRACGARATSRPASTCPRSAAAGPTRRCSRSSSATSPSASWSALRRFASPCSSTGSRARRPRARPAAPSSRSRGACASGRARRDHGAPPSRAARGRAASKRADGRWPVDATCERGRGRRRARAACRRGVVEAAAVERLEQRATPSAAASTRGTRTASWPASARQPRRSASPRWTLA